MPFKKARSNEAFEVFKKAVEMDYSLSDAHYELAIECAHRQFELARRHAIAGQELGHERMHT